MIRWSTGHIYIPDSVSSFQKIMGQWLEKQVKVGTVKVLSTNEELKSLKQPSNTASIEILKSPTFWANRSTIAQNSWRSSHAQGKAKTAKFFEMIHPSFGVLKVQKLSNNAKLPKKKYRWSSWIRPVCFTGLYHSSRRQGTSEDRTVNLISNSVSMPGLLQDQDLLSSGLLMLGQVLSMQTIVEKLVWFCSTMEARTLRSKWEIESPN